MHNWFQNGTTHEGGGGILASGSCSVFAEDGMHTQSVPRRQGHPHLGRRVCVSRRRVGVRHRRIQARTHGVTHAATHRNQGAHRAANDRRGSVEASTRGRVLAARASTASTG